MRLLRSPLLPAALLALAACRDLELPPPAAEGGVANAGPSLKFLAPEADAAVALSVAVRLEAADVDGVREVTLSCNDGVLLRRFTAEPYEADVNLAPCLSGSVGTVTLHADAVDRRGSGSEAGAAVTVAVDARSATLDVRAPARLAPRGSLSLTIDSDVSLQALPVVRVEGQSAQVTDVGPAGAPRQHFQATLATLPGLGTDLPDGGTADGATLTMLEEIERPLVIEVEALAQNGNLTRLAVPTVLSRIAWERSVPVKLADGAATNPLKLPAATPAELVLASGVGNWVPVYLAATNGALRALAPGSFDDGTSTFSGQAILDDGSVVLVSSAGDRIADVPPGATSAGPALATPYTLEQLHRVGASLCQWQNTDTDGTYTCGEYQLFCRGSDGVVTREPAPGGASDGSIFGNGYSVSGDVLGDFMNGCCPGAQFLAGGPHLSPRCVSHAGQGGYWFSSGTGEFATADYEFPAQFWSQSSPAAPYAAPRATLPAWMWQHDQLAYVRYGVQTTTIDAYRPGEAASFASVTLPGALSVIDRSSWPQGTGVLVGFTSSASALLPSDPTYAQGKQLLVLTPDLKPRWLYRYPYATSSLALVGDTAGASLLYLVDFENNRVVALYR